MPRKPFADQATYAAAVLLLPACAGVLGGELSKSPTNVPFTIWDRFCISRPISSCLCW